MRLTSGSSAIDTASDAAVPDDDFDLDRNGDTFEPLPWDLARGNRFLGTGPTVDMGAYEYLNTGDGLGDPEPPAAGAPAPEPSGTPYVAFTYDALGRRVERIADSGGAQVEVTRYYYEGENVILETDADEAPRRAYVHGTQYIDERVLVRVPTGQEYYYLPRELYSVAALTDEIGEIVEAATYDTYGKVALYDDSAQAVEESRVGNPYYFTGRRLDLLPLAGGLKQMYHYRARAYDPGNGRFLQRDPVTCCVRRSASSQVLYAAFDCSPTTKWDPYGLDPTLPVIGSVLKCLHLLECRQSLANALTDPEVQSRRNELAGRGCNPPIDCGVPGVGMCSDSGTGGGMHYWSWTVTMCASSFTAADLMHELIHAEDFCGKKGWPGGEEVSDPKDRWKPESVEEWACLEMRAYTCSGQYTSTSREDTKDMIRRCKHSVAKTLGLLGIEVTHRPDPTSQPGPSTRPGGETPSMADIERACALAVGEAGCNCLKRTP